MSITVQVRSFTGEIVSTLFPEPTAGDPTRNRVDDLVAAAHGLADRTGRYLLLTGVDQHGDTLFNVRQCARLRVELGELCQDLEPEFARAARSIVDLIDRFMTPGPDPSYLHRRLVFDGD